MLLGITRIIHTQQDEFVTLKVIIPWKKQAENIY